MVFLPVGHRTFLKFLKSHSIKEEKEQGTYNLTIQEGEPGGR